MCSHHVLVVVANGRDGSSGFVLSVQRPIRALNGQHQCERVSLQKESGQVVSASLHEHIPEDARARSTSYFFKGCWKCPRVLDDVSAFHDHLSQ